MPTPSESVYAEQKRQINRAKCKQYYAKHREARLEWQKKYYVEHKDHEQNRSSNYQKEHPDEVNAKNKRWRELHPVQNTSFRRKHYLKKQYGISHKEYNDLFLSQGGKCPICHSAEDSSKCPWHVDHDHATGKIRAILCRSCNLLLGNAKDNTEILLSAIEYLNRSKSVT